ncbi:outer dense fiber protein 3-like [Cimex lectularius]|uniref:Uncharacterized protein n=1 Tax=Cimex lectularius TaxID=79782 RepID=A0A8I6SDE5_CIMLE|nr:outer dense fiber protein 3-like [Cimex lectularius]
MPQSEFSQTASSIHHSDINSYRVGTQRSGLQSDNSPANGGIDEFGCVNQSPGPYTLPSLIGYKNHDITKCRAPAYTIAVKRPMPMPDNATPAPIYETFGLTKYGKANPPKATIRSRPPAFSVYADLGPGPGYYSPEKHLNAILPRAPAATIRSAKKTSLFDESPGPTFDPERVLGPRLPLRQSAPTATVKGRPPDFRVYSDSGPAPGHYNAVPIHKIMARAPSATIGGKWPGKSVYETEQSPAPNVYNPKVDNFGPRPPKAFMGIKHSNCKALVKIPEDTYSLVEF